MKIDILFLNDEMNGHDEYFDNDLFQEYCETHSFEGKNNSNGLLIESLVSRVKKNSIKEVILATSASIEGETTAH